VAYAFDDIVGDLPYPASYQTTEALVDAFYLSVDHAIQGHPYNSQHGPTAKDLISVRYDKSTRRYVFECGPKGARIELTMQRNLALLFGFDEPKEHTTISFAPIPKRHEPAVISKEDKEWSRMGHEIVRNPNMGFPSGKLPIAVESMFPVTPSLGTLSMYVLTDIIGDGASIHDGMRSNTLAVVPVDWSQEKSSVHTPTTRIAMPVRSRVIESINIRIQDLFGENIRFMSNDNLPVTVTLCLSRVQR
jgi:hypothetical protein